MGALARRLRLAGRGLQVQVARRGADRDPGRKGARREGKEEEGGVQGEGRRVLEPVLLRARAPREQVVPRVRGEAEGEPRGLPGDGGPEPQPPALPPGRGRGQGDRRHPGREEASGHDRRREAGGVQQADGLLPDRHVRTGHAGPRGHREVPRPHADRGPVPRDEGDAGDAPGVRADARAHPRAPHGLLHRAHHDAPHPAEDKVSARAGHGEGPRLDVRHPRRKARPGARELAG